MSARYKKSVFIFRRDIRLEDNLGLLTALDCSDEVIPVFVFDPRQTNPDKNEFFSVPAFHFLLTSLQELHDSLSNRGSKLQVFSGLPHEIVKNLIDDDEIDAVFVNKDYTPFSRKRDKKIADVCDERGVHFSRHDDCALASLEDIRTNQGNVYTVFTPFMKKAMEQEVPQPRKNNYSNFYSGTLKTDTTKVSEYNVDISNYELPLAGGRQEALKILKKNQYLQQYKDRRNIPADNGTSQLSAHHKFGTISIRESYHMAAEHAGKHSHFISELYWRDFYFYISYHFPKVFSESFLDWANNIQWVNDKKQFTAWCEGKTGVPMVDAGMRQLTQSGWMHNRSRMIVASYLTKNLLINWQWGEKFFAQHLIDYDPCQNNGGWQWSASTGADPRPLRIFNPFTQAQKYDADAEYIKKWIPELREVDASLLADGKVHDLSEHTEHYPSPLVDQTETFHRAMKVYKKAKI